MAEFGNHGCSERPWLQVDAPARHASLRLLDRVGGFGRHVVLVVLGQHFGGVEHAVGAELALRDHAFAFLEQVGQDAGVGDRDRLARCRSRRSARSGRRRAAGCRPRPGRRCGTRGPCGASLGGDLRRREEEHEVADWNAFSTSAAAMPSTARPPATIHATRLWRGLHAVRSIVVGMARAAARHAAPSARARRAATQRPARTARASAVTP